MEVELCTNGGNLDGGPTCDMAHILKDLLTTYK